ncbi:MAG: hypothetical protein AABX93_00840 [Nanoarchaeota archaeon]
MAGQYKFFVPKENYEEAKRLIRNLPSLRFDYNPIDLGSRYQICVSGDDKELGIIQDYSALMDSLRKNMPEKKKGFLERIAGAFGLD